MTHDEASGPMEPAENAAVVEWGGDDPQPARRRAGRFAALRSDPRLAPTVTGLSALALLFSLLSEWRLWTASASDEPAIRVSNGVASFPAVGTAFLLGVLVLTGCAALALYGSGAARHNARLVGLSAAAVVGAVLVMAAASLEELGGVVETQVTNPQAEANGWTVAVTLGRGLYLALTGTAGMAVALFLAGGRQVRASEPAAGTALAGDPAASTGAWPFDGGRDDWPWRPRPTQVRGAAPAGPAAGPVDLTVQPAEPFLPPGDTGQLR